MNILNFLNKKELYAVKYKTLRKNDILYYENEECNEIGIVLSGSLIIKSSLVNGHEIVYKIINKNDIFGINLLFSNDNHYKGDVISLEDTRIALIAKEDIINLLHSNKNFLNVYLQIQSNIGLKANEKIKLFSFNKAEDRFLFYLSINNNAIEYSTITNLAKELGLERETLSRLITRLIKNKKITKDQKTIKLNITTNRY